MAARTWFRRTISRERWLINKFDDKSPSTLALSDPASQLPFLSFEALGGLILNSAGT